MINQHQDGFCTTIHLHKQIPPHDVCYERFPANPETNHHEPYNRISNFVSLKLSGKHHAQDVVPSSNRGSVHKMICWWLCSECKCSKSIHDKVDPKQLYQTKPLYFLCSLFLPYLKSLKFFSESIKIGKVQLTCTAFRGTSPEDIAATTLIIRAATFTVSWNCMNF